MQLADTAPPLSRDRRTAASPFLFSWDAADGTTQARTGQAPTYYRAGWGSYIDARGYIRHAPAWRPRFSHAQLGGAVGLLMERASTNYVRASEELSNAAYWTAGGGVGLSAVAGPGLSAHRLTDANAGAQGALTQVVAMPAGWHALSVCWRAGTSGGSVFGCGSVRALVVPDADGAPVVTMDTGRHLGVQRLADGWWRLLFGSTATQVAANFTVSIAPANSIAGNNALQGHADFSGVMLEAWPTPSSYVRSVGGAVGVRPSERLTYAGLWLPRDITIYGEWGRPAWAGITLPVGHRTAVNVGGDSALLGCQSATAGLVGAYSVGDALAAAGTAYPAGAFGDRVRAAARFSGIASALAVEVEVEGGTTAASGPVGGALGAYGLATISIGAHQTVPGNEFDGLIHRIRIGAGARPLAAMREGY